MKATKVRFGEFQGIGSVFRFTLVQMLKSKGNIVSIVILIVFSIFFIPVMSVFQMDGSAFTELSGKETISDIENVYLINETGIELSAENVKAVGGTMFSDAKIELLGDGGNTDGISPGADDVMVKIYFDEKSGEYKIRPSLSDNSNIEADECRNAAEAVLSAFEKARINAAGISDNQLLSLTADTDVTVDTVKDYISASDSDLSTQYSVQIIYSVVTMMLCIMAASYIVRSVAEEKASKLIDTLLISTKPLVLVFGKILAVMAYVFGMIAVMAICMLTSYKISSQFMNISYQNTPFGGLSLEQLNISPFTVVVVIVSLLISFLIFALIAGISGAGCSSMEDIQPACMAAMLLSMGGYMISCIVSGFQNRAAAVISSLIPFVSCYCAPAQYLLGNINISVLIISWILQLAVAAFLVVLSARVYGYLVLYKGTRLKFTQIILMGLGVKHTSKRAGDGGRGLK